MPNVAYNITPSFIVLVLDNKTHNVPSTHPNFEKIKDALRKQDFAVLPNLVDIPAAVNRFSAGKVTVEHGQVLYNGEAVTSAVAGVILNLMRDGFNVDPLVNFLSKLMQNPSYRSREQLYGFIEANKITLTPDGDLLLYKRVSGTAPDRLFDCHTLTISNNIGTVVKMDRSKVDDDPNRTCSAGLHVCSLAYLSHFGGDVTVLVKVNPANVVAIPTDYNNSKMRVCEYEVVGVHENGDNTEATDKTVWEGPFEDDEYDADDVCTCSRDLDGAGEGLV